MTPEPAQRSYRSVTTVLCRWRRLPLRARPDRPRNTGADRGRNRRTHQRTCRVRQPAHRRRCRRDRCPTSQCRWLALPGDHGCVPVTRHPTRYYRLTPRRHAPDPRRRTRRPLPSSAMSRTGGGERCKPVNVTAVSFSPGAIALFTRSVSGTTTTHLRGLGRSTHGRMVDRPVRTQRRHLVRPRAGSGRRRRRR